jgi:hypothetical protein
MNPQSGSIKEVTFEVGAPSGEIPFILNIRMTDMKPQKYYASLS